jgi:hypothetical protein
MGYPPQLAQGHIGLVEREARFRSFAPDRERELSNRLKFNGLFTLSVILSQPGTMKDQSGIRILGLKK